MTLFKNRNNYPVAFSGILTGLFFLGSYLIVDVSGIIWEGESIMDLIINGPDEAMYNRNMQGLGGLRLGLLLFCGSIGVNYIAIVVFYRQILLKEKNLKSNLIVIFFGIGMPYLALIAIWYLQSNNYRQYYQNKQNLVVLSNQNLISLSEFNKKTEELNANYFGKIANHKETQEFNSMENIKNKNHQKLKELRDSGILTEKEFEDKVKAL